MSRARVVTVLLALLCAGAAPQADPSVRVAAERAAARRTREVLEAKLAERDRDLRDRVRALYKLTRGGLDALWVDASARAELVRRRAAARRMLVRDLEERKILANELAAASAAERRLLEEEAELAAREDAEAPLPARSLVRPVEGEIAGAFGLVADRATRARWLRRGIDLVSDAGEEVAAPATGLVLWAGPLRGAGQAVVIDAGEQVTTVVTQLGKVVVRRGDAVQAGEVLGTAAGRRIGLEVRRRTRPVDPTRLVARPE